MGVVGVPSRVAEVRHPGVLDDLAMSTCQVVSDSLHPLEVGVVGVSLKVREGEVARAK